MFQRKSRRTGARFDAFIAAKWDLPLLATVGSPRLRAPKKFRVGAGVFPPFKQLSAFTRSPRKTVLFSPRTSHSAVNNCGSPGGFQLFDRPAEMVIPRRPQAAIDSLGRKRSPTACFALAMWRKGSPTPPREAAMPWAKVPGAGR